MYIRSKKNKSGSVSFHIFCKDGRKQVHVKSIGTAKGENEIKLLELKAHEELLSLKRQSSFELKFDEDEKFISTFFNSLQQVRSAGYELILGKIFNEIGFDAVPDDLFRHLVISRISNPGSKLKTVNYLLESFGIFYKIDAVYRYLDRLNADYKDLLQDISFQHTLSLFEGQINVLFYDVTTLYFEAEDEDDLRKTGFSKDGKAQHPQIVLGLLVSRGGYPLAFEMFEGNRFEGKTMLPVVEAFQKKYGVDKSIVVADAGLLSLENIEALIEQGYGFILGARIKNESVLIKEQILNLKLENGQSKEILKPSGLRLIVSYSSSRAIKDKKNRERGLRRLEQSLKSGRLTKRHINNRGYNKFLKLKGKIDVSIDYEKFNKEGKWDGIKGYLTNTTLSPTEVIEQYGDLWQIEKAFRISKTDLRIRPIYHRLKHRIETHLIIAFCSYKLYKELERQLKEKKSGITVEKAVRLMQTIFTLDIKLPVSGKTKTLIHTRTEDQKRLLKFFEVDFQMGGSNA